MVSCPSANLQDLLVAKTCSRPFAADHYPAKCTKQPPTTLERCLQQETESLADAVVIPRSATVAYIDLSWDGLTCFPPKAHFSSFDAHCRCHVDRLYSALMLPLLATDATGATYTVVWLPSAGLRTEMPSDTRCLGPAQSFCTPNAVRPSH